MKKAIKLILLIAVFGLLIWPIYYFANKRTSGNLGYKLEKPFNKDIQNFVICSGVILPKEEVEIKSRISGVLEKIYVTLGEKVHKNQIIAKIKIIPDVGEMALAESRVNTARINFENQRSIYNRNRLLIDKEIISRAEFESIQTNYLNAKEELNKSIKEFSIIKSGNDSNKQSNTSIISTIEGYVTLLPSKIGSSIIQSNNFNEGSTIAKVAKINEMVFDGNVTEDEVENLKLGMPVLISTALNKKVNSGNLIEISTSGKDTNGIITFNIKSNLKSAETKKTGFSANAKILTRELKNILCIKEEWMTIENESIYVYVKKKEDLFLKRQITVGMSDGIYIEVRSGLNKNEIIKVDDK